METHLVGVTVMMVPPISRFVSGYLQSAVWIQAVNPKDREEAEVIRTRYLRHGMS